MNTVSPSSTSLLNVNSNVHNRCKTCASFIECLVNDRCMSSLGCHGMVPLSSAPDSTHDAETCETHIPESEWKLQFESLTVFHQMLGPKYNDDVESGVNQGISPSCAKPRHPRLFIEIILHVP